jgi:hypothetical protein
MQQDIADHVGQVQNVIDRTTALHLANKDPQLLSQSADVKARFQTITSLAKVCKIVGAIRALCCI